MSGWEGVIDTANGTSRSGYVHRRMARLMEDIKVCYDQTVRKNGYIIQFAYGGDNLCGTKTVIHKDMPKICDVARIIEKFNSEYETSAMHKTIGEEEDNK
jgi:DNA-directed RNA polymerase III subunit RPC1